MKCRAVRSRLSQYLEQDLPSAQHQEIAQHLDLCASCRAEAESLRASLQALATLSVLEPAPDLLADLRRRIAAPSAKRVRWAWSGVAVAAVAAMLIWLRPETKTALPPMSRPVAPRAEATRPAPPRVAAAPAPVARQDVVRRPRLSVAWATSRPRPTRAVTPHPTESPAPSPQQPEASPPAPVETVQATGGIILILGDPIPPLTESRCHLELTLADGTRSVYERNTKPGENGRPDTIAVAYERTDPDTTTTN